jgi:glycosyltransferase involved in cell wall biosynthesis
MRIVIDMQGAQTVSRFHSIGPYTLSFAQAVVRNRGEHEIILALSGLFPETIEPIRAAFDGVLPQENIRVWRVLGPLKASEPGNENRREVAELLRESFFASLQPDVVHISSLFEGYQDDAITSIGCFDKATPVSVTLHESLELPTIEASNWETFCLRKQRDLQLAHFSLTAKTTAQDAILAWEALPRRASIYANYFAQPTGYGHLLKSVVAHTRGFDENGVLALSHCIASNESSGIERQLLLDVSMLLQHDYAAEELYVLRSYLRWLLQSPPQGLRVEPVYATPDDGYCFARRFTLRFLGQDVGQAIDAPVRWQRGDVLISLAIQERIKLAHALFYRRLRQEGGVVKFLINDQLSIDDKDSVKDTEGQLTQNQWLTMITNSDGAVFLSKASYDAFKSLITDIGVPCRPTFQCDLVCLDYGLNDSTSSQQQDFEKLSEVLTESHCSRRQLLVDISSLVQKDHRTGIQRVVRGILREWMITPPKNYRVEPIYATSTHGYRYAREFVKQFMGVEAIVLADEPIEFAPNDVFLGLDLNHHVTIVHRPFLEELRRHGVNMAFIVYDLLPIKFPQFWEPQHSVHTVHAEWLQVVTGLGSAVCISQSVANELEEWIKTNPYSSVRKNHVDWFHLGADVENSQPTDGLLPNATATVTSIKNRPSFLMVGTLEPRKGHTQVLDAFELLWKTGAGINLVIVGKQGWMVENLIERLRKHPEANRHLFWLDGISDEYLDKVYDCSTCLIAASYGEGFGLPLIEAANHKLPIIARDIPVFREVAGEHAYYFNGEGSKELSDSITSWLGLLSIKQHPDSSRIIRITWKQSARNLEKILLK